MTSEQKEQLRKEFDEKLRFDAVLDWFYSKLEEKDSEIVRITLRMNEFDRSNTQKSDALIRLQSHYKDIQSKLSAKDSLLKAAELLIGLSCPPENPDAKKIWEEYRETYKTLKQ